MSKKKLIAFIAIFALMIQLATFSIIAATPLIYLDFEGTAATDTAYVISKGASSMWNNGFTHTTAQKSSGNQSIQLNPSTSVGFSFWYDAPASNKLTAGVEYTLAVKAKTVNHNPNGKNWRLYLLVDGQGAVASQFKSGNNDWEWLTVKKTFSASDLQRKISLGYDILGSGTPSGNIYLDDMIFGETTDVEAKMTQLGWVKPVHNLPLIYHDFEGGMPTLNPAVTAESTTAEISDEFSASGSKSVKFPLTAAPSILDSVAIAPGALKKDVSYTLAVRIKTVNYVKAEPMGFDLTIIDYNGNSYNNKGVVAPESGTEDWKWYTVTHVMNSDTTGLPLAGLINNASSPATGAFYMDDMIFGLTAEVQAKMAELGEASSGFPLIYHDFEAGIPPLTGIVTNTTAAISTEHSASGSKSVKIPHSLSIADSFAIDTPKELKAGTEYTVAIRIKTVNYVQPNVAGYDIGFFEYGGKQGNSYAEVGPTTGSEDWKWYIATHTIATDSSSVVFGLINNSPANGALGSGHLYIDDLIVGLTDEVLAKIMALDPNQANFDMIALDFEENQIADHNYLLSKGFGGSWNNGFNFATAHSYTGNQSLELNPAASVGYSFWYNAPAGSKLTPATEYTWALKVKTIGHVQSGLKWRATITVDNGRSISVEFKAGDNDWEWYEVKAAFTPEELAKTITITFDKDGTSTGSGPEGRIYIDSMAFGKKADVEKFKADTDNSLIYDTLVLSSGGGVQIKDGVLYGISAGTSVDSLKSRFKNANSTLFVYDSNNQLLPLSGTATTGATLKLIIDGVTKQTVSVVIYGDVNGDGSINSADIISQWEHIFGRTILTGMQFNAAKVYGFGSEITVFDVIEIRNII